MSKKTNAPAPIGSIPGIRRGPLPGQPYGKMDASGNVTICHPNGQPMTQAEIAKMASDAAAEQAIWDAADEKGKRDILDQMTGGMFGKLFP